MAEKKDPNKRHEWMGRPVTGPKDVETLEQLAAVKEFAGKLPRHEAEKAAYKEYMRQQHLAGASHHLSGMKQAGAAGKSDEAAKQHFMYYAAHMGQLGYDPYDAVPPEVADHQMPSASDTKAYKFRGHTADDFALHTDKKDDMAKAESDRCPGKNKDGRACLLNTSRLFEGQHYCFKHAKDLPPPTKDNWRKPSK